MIKLVTNFALTGDCTVSVKEVIRRWNKSWFISQWQDKYTLCNKRLKVQISKPQAKEIIVELDLMPQQSPVFRSGKTWRKQEDFPHLTGTELTINLEKVKV